MANFKILDTFENEEYIFNTDAFRTLVKEYKNKSAKNLTIDSIRYDIAIHCNKSDETIKKWYRGHNGPSDIDTLRDVANFFNVDYQDLLIPKYSIDSKHIINEPEDFTMNLAPEINFQTVRFIALLNELANNMENGIIPFSQITMDTRRDALIYDDINIPTHDYRLVLDKCVDDIHHDIISYYDEYYPDLFNYCIGGPYLINNDEYGTYIEILTTSGDIYIIEEGSWYIC